jgi:hypothetical protein
VPLLSGPFRGTRGPRQAPTRATFRPERKFLPLPHLPAYLHQHCNILISENEKKILILSPFQAIAQKHVNAHHPSEHMRSRVKYKCKICLQLLPSIISMRSHFSSWHLKTMVYKCRLCSDTLKTKKSLNHHMKVLFNCVISSCDLKNLFCLGHTFRGQKTRLQHLQQGVFEQKSLHDSLQDEAQ